MNPARVVAVLTVLLTALGLAPATATADPAPAGGDRPAVRCEFIPTPDKPAAKPVTAPSPRAAARGTVTAVLATNYGPVVAELDRSNAPCAVHNFAHLARNLFYNQTQCWRLTNSARLGVLQCGDIVEVEVGGPGYRFADEVTGQETYPRGTIAMGNQGPDTNGSQFFFVHSHANIAPAYTVLGRVVYGMDTLDRIVAAGIKDGAQDGLPAKPVRIHLAVAW
ncbi:peptidylprolyl isomerase [Actinophytocola xinjiangensis]|jgi:peptidyl-prolyl cis-trans isomerase B (cyclophilin B)|uniref:Peptidyl-prolyl cis-trans isomerase n=1 Tax=Actinophytocola xinjiangensis TaxID=485602 RepID=A0A7Z0WK25_9PSEU|nr:peptidylprolyl isomerase [Actinophytocola xinjiangensis]OLF08866.1 peptidylprolyl isomerase [Actinophytocola xinjiangensis]